MACLDYVADIFRRDCLPDGYVLCDIYEAYIVPVSGVFGVSGASDVSDVSGVRCAEAEIASLKKELDRANQASH